MSVCVCERVCLKRRKRWHVACVCVLVCVCVRERKEAEGSLLDEEVCEEDGMAVCIVLCLRENVLCL